MMTHARTWALPTSGLREKAENSIIQFNGTPAIGVPSLLTHSA